jgi:hypothetical protein
MSDKALTNTDHGVATHLERVGHLFIRPPITRNRTVDFEQDTRVRQFSGGGFPCRDQVVKRAALLLTQEDFMFVEAS